jgi:hypothetical protein
MTLQPQTPQLLQVFEELSKSADQVEVAVKPATVAARRGVVRPGPERAREELGMEFYRGRWYTREEFGRVCLAEWKLEQERKRRAQEEAKQWQLDRLVLQHQQYQRETQRREQQKRQEASWAAAAHRAAIAASREPPKPVRRKRAYLTYVARQRFKAALPVVVMVVSVLAVLSLRPTFDLGVAPTVLRTPTAVEQSHSEGVKRGRTASAPGRRRSYRSPTVKASPSRREPDGRLSAQGWPFLRWSN